MDETRRALARLSWVLALCACSKSTQSAAERTSVEHPAEEVRERPAQEDPAQRIAERELDRTIWDCEWSIAVFWGPHWHRAHKDVAMLAMGGGGLFSSEDYELSYGPERGFAAGIRHREYPNGQRGPEEFDEPARPFRYTIDGDRLTISADHWQDRPLECERGCYDQAFIDFMDARYEMHTPLDSVAEKRRAPECGG